MPAVIVETAHSRYEFDPDDEPKLFKRLPGEGINGLDGDGNWQPYYDASPWPPVVGFPLFLMLGNGRVRQTTEVVSVSE